MDIGILIALASGITSLLVALISLLTAFLSSRATSRTAESLERLKYSLSSSTRASELTRAESLRSLESLKLAMEAIQVVKDEVQLAVYAYEDSLQAKEMADRLEAARQNLFKVYEEMHPILSEREATVLHTAKNSGFWACQTLGMELKKVKYASDINDTIRQESLQRRSELTDAQNLLRDFRTERLIDLSISG
jgi:hypothetical protein